MNLNSVLARLGEFKVRVFRNEVDANGWRTVIVGCAAPSPPFAIGRFLYSTWVMGPGEEDVPREVRDAIRRRLWHGTTDIFGDDEEDAPALAAIDIDDMLVGAPPPGEDPEISN
jgi:hypothetical protein